MSPSSRLNSNHLQDMSYNLLQHEEETQGASKQNNLVTVRVYQMPALCPLLHYAAIHPLVLLSTCTCMILV